MMRQSAFTVLSERVGHVVARKEADIGFQQASEASAGAIRETGLEPLFPKI
jgi:hypothetical protein